MSWNNNQLLTQTEQKSTVGLLFSPLLASSLSLLSLFPFTNLSQLLIA